MSARVVEFRYADETTAAALDGLHRSGAGSLRAV
jgi:hypothetical protein